MGCLGADTDIEVDLDADIDDDPMTKAAGQLGLIGDHLARLADGR